LSRDYGIDVFWATEFVANVAAKHELNPLADRLRRCMIRQMCQPFMIIVHEYGHEKFFQKIQGFRMPDILQDRLRSIIRR
jgi:hypothetical protein